jgi:hypothetical protein
MHGIYMYEKNDISSVHSHNHPIIFLPSAIEAISIVMAVFNGAECVSNVLLLKGITYVSTMLYR